MRKSYHELTDEDLARICHEAHLAFSVGLNDSRDDVRWDALPQERKDVVINQVRLFREGKSLTEVHQAWVDHQLAHGWRYGISRNRMEKIHPNLVPYEKLPVEEQAKVRQAQRIVFTHVTPEALEEIAYKDIRSRSWDEISAGSVYDDTGPVVCVTHKRFIPCRKEEGCILSGDEEDIETVRKYQQG